MSERSEECVFMGEQSGADVKLGRFLSLVLRHNPGAAGISLDGHGWADVEELLAGVNRTGTSTTGRPAGVCPKSRGRASEE